MNVHKNARLTPQGRSLAVQRVLGGERAVHVAMGCGVSVRTIWKWVRRCREADAVTLAATTDRSSRPQRIARQTPRYRRRQVLRARHKRWSSLRIAQYYALPVSTVVTLLRRHGLHRLALPSLLQRRAPAHRARLHYATPAPRDETVNNVFVNNI